MPRISIPRLRQRQGPRGNGIEVNSQAFDHVAKFQPLKPTRRNRADAHLGTEKVPRERPSTVTVARVIDREQHTIPKILRHQGAADSNRNCLFSYPAGAETFKLFGAWAATRGKHTGSIDSPCNFIVSAVSPKLRIGAIKRLAEGFTTKQCRYHNGKVPGREAARRVAVGESGSLSCKRKAPTCVLDRRLEVGVLFGLAFDAGDEHSIIPLDRRDYVVIATAAIDV